VANHLGLDLDLVELLAGVDTDDAADHLGDNDHVTEVGLDEVGLLVGLGLLLGLAKLLDQTHGLALETAVEPSAGTGVDEVTELLRAKVQEPGGKVSMPLPIDVWFPAQSSVAGGGGRTGRGRLHGRRTCGTSAWP
jgi:hypothetical protein